MAHPVRGWSQPYQSLYGGRAKDLGLWDSEAIKYMIIMSFSYYIIRNHLMYEKQLMQCFTGKLVMAIFWFGATSKVTT